MPSKTADEFVELCRRRNPDLLASKRIVIRVEELERSLKLAWLDGALSATKPLRDAREAAELPPGFEELFKPFRH